VAGGFDWFGLNWGDHQASGKGGCHLSNSAMPKSDGAKCTQNDDAGGNFLGEEQSMAVYAVVK
jgi:hypothetical protein